jgi:pSer/pThr/pTyr-binding forkhead associated (FHA) protein
MSEPAKEQLAHVLQGPHTELHWAEPVRPLRLQVQAGGARITLHQAEALVGRHSEADVRLTAPEVSRRHCRLVFEAGRWRIIDLQSLNGVYVNDERVRETVLFDGDRVRVGGCTLIIEQATPLRAAIPERGSDSKVKVLKSIADVLPKAS